MSVFYCNTGLGDRKERKATKKVLTEKNFGSRIKLLREKK